MNDILGFFGKYRFLSNFEYATITYEGKEYISNEHAFQACKCVNELDHELIRNSLTARDAKNLGGKVIRRNDWEFVKDSVMLDINRIKYLKPYLREQLLATGDAYLEETNNWNDTYWGVCNSIGLNKLGHILMQVRKEIRSSSIEA